MNIEFFEWEDSHDISTMEWRDIEELKSELGKPVVVSSVGYLVAEDDDSVLIASTIGKHADGQNACHAFKIPKGCIRNRYRMSVAG